MELDNLNRLEVVRAQEVIADALLAVLVSYEKHPENDSLKECVESMQKDLERVGEFIRAKDVSGWSKPSKAMRIFLTGKI